MYKKDTLKVSHVLSVFFLILFLFFYFWYTGLPIILPFLFLFLALHLSSFGKANFRMLLNLGFMLVITIFSTYALLQYTDIPVLYIPVASIATLIMLLYNDLQLALIVGFMGSVSVGLMVASDLGLMLIYFLGSLAGAFTVRDARTRGKMISACIYVSLVQICCAALLYSNFPYILSSEFFFSMVKPLMINGILSVFVIITTLKIFELLFGVLTNFSLIELSDFNQPLLKRMILEAPGTYHHSIIVSNLAETAADVIGANSLLARVGAYYHDVGKMAKSEYFTENQLVGGNKHDNIEPSISRLVILNHVKEGIELAKKYRLHPAIIDFIPQHHGTSLMYYFYQKALEEAEDESSIKEENYRYPGPKPQSREAAIVLLADSVEAATRSLDEPNPLKIEETVRRIINNKFIDGQLDECNLTLREIEEIAKTFSRILGAMYHVRVKYPDKKDVDGSNKKSAETDSSQENADKRNRSENPSN